MANITVSIEVPVPPQRVWEVVEPIEDHVGWMADAEAIRFVADQRRGVGTRFDCDTRVGPFRLTDRMEITQWQPGVIMGVAHHGVVRGSGRFTLAPLLGGRHTRFTWAETLVFPWFLGGPLGAWVGAKLVLTPIWRGNLRRLVRQIQAEQPAGASEPAAALR